MFTILSYLRHLTKTNTNISIFLFCFFYLASKNVHFFSQANLHCSYATNISRWSVFRNVMLYHRGWYIFTLLAINFLLNCNNLQSLFQFIIRTRFDLYAQIAVEYKMPFSMLESFRSFLEHQKKDKIDQTKKSE